MGVGMECRELIIIITGMGYGNGFRVIGKGAQLISRRSYYSSNLMIPLGKPSSFVCSNYRAMAMLASREGGLGSFYLLVSQFIARRFFVGFIVLYTNILLLPLKSTVIWHISPFLFFLPWF